MNNTSSSHSHQFHVYGENGGRGGRRGGGYEDEMTMDSADLSDTDTLTLLTSGCVKNMNSSESIDSRNIDAVLGRIEMELMNIGKRKEADEKLRMTSSGRPQDSGRVKSKRLNKKDRDVLSEQGVVFDTGDETNSEMKLTLENLSRLKQLKGGRPSPDGNDTGLGSAALSMDGENMSEDAPSTPHQMALPSSISTSGRKGQRKTIQVEEDVEDDERRSRRSSGCSSSGYNNLAQHINARFEQLMMMNDFSDAPASTSRSWKQDDQTDLESVKTEDIEMEFNRTLVNRDGSFTSTDVGNNQSKVPGNLSSGVILRGGGTRNATRTSMSSDADSVRTENISDRFQALIASQNVSRISNTSDRFFRDAHLNSDVLKISPIDEASDENRESALMIANKFQQHIQHSSPARLSSSQQRYDESETRCTSTSSNARLGMSNEPLAAEFYNDRHQSEENISKNNMVCFQQGVQQNGGRNGRDFLHNDRMLDADAVEDVSMEWTNERKNNVINVSSKSLDRQTGKKSSLMTKSQSSIQLQNKIDLEVSLKLQEELTNLQTQLKQSIQTKQGTLKEVEHLRQMSLKYREEVKQVERLVKDNRLKAEDARTELMLLEFKRDTAQKQLQQLIVEVDEKQKRVEKLESSGKKLQDIGFTTEEITRMISEREEMNEKMKVLEMSQKSQNSIEESLTSAKETIISEQKKFREKLFVLQEKLEQSEASVEELSGDKEGLEDKLKQLEKRFQALQTEKSNLIKDKNRESTSVQSELSKHMEEVVILRQHLNEATEQTKSIKMEISRKDDQIYQMREQEKNLKHELTKQNQLRDAFVDENLKTLLLEKEVALNKLNQDADREKAEALEELRQQQHQQSLHTLQNIELRFSQQLSKMHAELENKELDVQNLTDRLKQQDAWVKQMTDRIKDETYEKFQQLLDEERMKIESEKEAEISSKLRNAHDDMERNVRQLSEDLNHERNQSQNYNRQMIKLKEELEDAKHGCRQIEREKLELLDKIETIEMDKQKQIDHFRQKLEQEVHCSMGKLEDTVEDQAEELEKLKTEKKELEMLEQDHSVATEKYEQDVVDDMSQEYQRILQLLNKCPTRITTRACYAWSPVKLTISKGGIGIRSILTATLESLKTAIEELRQEVIQLRCEVEKNSQMTMKLERDKREELDALRSKMQSEKLQALEMLKDRLIKSFGQPQRLKEQRRRQQQLDRDRVIDGPRKAAVSYNGPVIAVHNGTSSSTEYLKIVNQLQSKVQDLQMENFSLRRNTKLSSSVPDLTAAVFKEQPVLVSGPSEKNNETSQVDRDESLRVRQLEMSIKRAENQTKMSEERAKKNEQLLNQKLIEMSRIQETVTQQTKELLQLQRAYSQLQNRCPSPTRNSVAVKSS